MASNANHLSFNLLKGVRAIATWTVKRLSKVVALVLMMRPTDVWQMQAAPSASEEASVLTGLMAHQNVQLEPFQLLGVQENV